MMTIEAIKLALEALKENHYYMIDAGLPNQSMLNKTLTAYKALEEALAKQEQDKPVSGFFSREAMKEHSDFHPQPKQEQGEPDDEVLGFNGWGFPIEHPPKPTPANKEQIREALVFNLPLYTTPQQRKPLTDEQKKSIARRAFKDICKDYPVEDRIIEVIEDIEDYHGIKENNNG